MRLLRRASARHLLLHRGQLALSILGVALGVAVVVAIDLAIGSSREAFRASTETVAGRATHHVVGGAGGLDESVLTEVRTSLGLRAAAPVVEAVAASPALPGRALRVLGVDPFSEAQFRPWLAGGPGGLDVSRLVTTRFGVVLEAGTAEAAGVRTGDTLPLRFGGLDVEMPVVGVLSPADELTRAGLRDVLMMDIASAQDLVGRQGRLSRVDLRLPEGESGARLARAVEELLPPDARLEATGTRAETLSAMIAAFDLNLTALSFLALMFGMFLIYNAQTFSVVQRREMFGGLRALGVTRGEILRVILFESVWIGAAGAALGVGIGVVLGRGLVRMVTRTINDLYFVVSVDSLRISPDILIKGALLGLGATVVAALVPAREAASTTPRLARIRSVVEERARRAVPRAAVLGVGAAALGAGLLFVPTGSLGASFAGLFLVMLGMALLTPLGTVILVGLFRPLLARGVGILGSMASRGVVTALSRTAPAIASLVVAVSVTVGLGVMIQSFRGTLIDWLDGTLQADVYVSFPSVQAARAEGTFPAGVIPALVAHPAVVGSSTYRGVDLPIGGGVVRVVALDLDVRGEAAFDFLEGTRAAAFASFRIGGGVLVSEPYAYRGGVGVGDTLTLPTPAGSASFPVAGVFYDYASDQGVVMMSRSTFDRHWDDPGVTSLAIFLAEDVDVEAVVRQMEAGVPPGLTLSIRTNRALREGSVAVFDRTFQVTAVLRLLAFVVAFVGVVSALTALELERGRELGVLRANGMTPGQVWAMVTTQTGLMGLVSGIMAVPMGLVLAVIMIFVVNKRGFGWTLHMEVGWPVLVQAVGLAVVGALIAGVVPAFRMARTSPAAALRGE